MHLPLENEANVGFFFHTKVLALVLLCLFTFFLSLKVQDMIFESDDKTFNDAFISTPKVLMLEMTAATEGLLFHKSHVIFLTPVHLSFLTDHQEDTINLFANVSKTGMFQPALDSS